MDLAEQPTHPFNRHPWELARFRFLRRLLADAGLLACPARILDAGAGDAWFATQLLQAMPVGTEMTCWDAGYSPTEIAERTARSGDALRFSTRRPDARFDLLL